MAGKTVAVALSSSCFFGSAASNGEFPPKVCDYTLPLGFSVDSLRPPFACSSSLLVLRVGPCVGERSGNFLKDVSSIGISTLALNPSPDAAPQRTEGGGMMTVAVVVVIMTMMCSTSTAA